MAKSAFLDQWASRIYANFAAATGGVFGIKDGALVTLPFSKEYVSPEQTVTAGTVTALTHNLGGMPKLLRVSYVCKIAQLGYAVGDEVEGQFDYVSSTYGAGMGCNETTIRLHVGSSGLAALSTTGVVTALTAANWCIIVRAWL